MTQVASRGAARQKRHERIRLRLSGSPERPRLVVFRSNKHISAQVIDDTSGKTLAAASSLEKDLRASGQKKNDEAKRRPTTLASSVFFWPDARRSFSRLEAAANVLPEVSSITWAEMCLLLRNTTRRGRSGEPERRSLIRSCRFWRAAMRLPTCVIVLVPSCCSDGSLLAADLAGLAGLTADLLT